jgi:hypothetical protein
VRIWVREVARAELVVWSSLMLLVVVSVIILFWKSLSADDSDGYWQCMDQGDRRFNAPMLGSGRLMMHSMPQTRYA